MSIPPFNRRRSTAFTLLEVMISMTIFMMVMGSIMACWKCIVNGKLVAEKAAGDAQRARVGIQTVVDALTATELSLVNTEHYVFLADTSSKFAALSLAAKLPSDFPGSGLFGDLSIRRVSFDVETVDGTNNLVMNQSPLLEALTGAYTPYPLTLARDVSIFHLEFWNIKNAEWEVGFDATNDLPPMVRVTLGVGHSENHPDVPYDLIIRTVAIPCRPHM